jgi:hypothetical protein
MGDSQRAYVEATEAVTWIAFGETRDAAAMLRAILDAASASRRTEEAPRLEEAERALLEACRREQLTLLGTRVQRGKEPDGSADPEPVPVAYLLRPVAITLHHNRLTYDWDRIGPKTRNWSHDYADLRVRFDDVRRLWPHGTGVMPAKAPAPRNTGGRPAKYDWDAFDREMMRRANHPDGLPDRNVLMHEMAEWCREQWGAEPTASTLRARIARLWPQ